MMKQKAVIFLLLSVFLTVQAYCGEEVRKETPPELSVTRYSVVFWGKAAVHGKNIEPGSEIQVFDPNEVLVGKFTVQTKGYYGPLFVYGDDPDSQEEDEGANRGDMLRVMIDGTQVASKEFRWTVDKDVINVDIVLGDEDRTAPEVVKVEAKDRNHICVMFNESVDKVSATDVRNYKILKYQSEETIKVNKAKLLDDQTTVELEIENQTPEMEYALEISRVTDIFHNIMQPQSLVFGGR